MAATIPRMRATGLWRPEAMLLAGPVVALAVVLVAVSLALVLSTLLFVVVLLFLVKCVAALDTEVVALEAMDVTDTDVVALTSRLELPTAAEEAAVPPE